MVIYSKYILHKHARSLYIKLCLALITAFKKEDYYHPYTSLFIWISLFHYQRNNELDFSDAIDARKGICSVLDSCL